MQFFGWSAGLLACVRRECQEWARSPGEIFFCQYVPVFWLLVVWGLLGQGVITQVPVAFVDEDKSPMSRAVERAVGSNRAFGLVDYESRMEALSAMRAGRLYAVVVVPFGYSRQQLTGTGSSVLMYVDENRYAVAGTLQAEINSVISSLSSEKIFPLVLRLGDGAAGAKRILSAIHSDFYALGNMQFSFLAFLGGALIPGVIMVGAMLGFVTSILRETWRNSAQDWLASAGNSFSAAIFGKILPHYAFYCLVFLFYIALFCGQGGFAPAGSLLVWFALGAACLAAFAAMAILVTAIAPSWRLALVVASGYAAPALPFTGFSIPLDSMGEYARAFSQCLPLTWLIQGQAQQWTLGSSVAESGSTFLAFFLLILFPLLPGYPLAKKRFARKSDVLEGKA